MLCWFFSGYLVTTGQSFLGIFKETRCLDVENCEHREFPSFLFLDCDRKSVIQNFDVMLENVRGSRLFGCVVGIFL